jgi:small-conductance mechanosensitive channel
MSSRSGLKKLALPVALVAIVILAGGTSLLSQATSDLVGTSLKEFLLSLKPHVLNISLALAAVNLAWLGFGPSVRALEGMLDQVETEETTRELAVKAFKLAYWALLALSTLSFFSINLTVLMVGLGLLLKTPAEAITSSFLIFWCRSVKKGDRVEFVEKPAVKGTVLDVGYFATRIDTADGIITVPNNKVWDNLVMVMTPAAAPLSPPGA